MGYVSTGGLAALAICLGCAQSAHADDYVNATSSALDFQLREAEIRRAKAAEAAGAPVPESVQEKREAAVERVEEARRVEDAAKGPAPGKTAGSASAAARAAAEPATTSPRALAAPAGSEGLRAIVARHAAANGVPFALADAVVRIESRYNPRAANAGNYGLMQIRHQTARGMGYSGGAGGLLDAETNARYAMKYLAQAYRLAGGDTCRTVMKYQSGHMAARMSGANRTYCAKVRTITARN